MSVALEKGLEARLAQLVEDASRTSQMAEVFFVARSATPVEFENNRLKTINTAEHAGVALRVVVDGQVGFANTSKLDALDEILEYAVQSARYGGPAQFDMPGPGEVPDTSNDAGWYDPAVPRLAVESMVDLGRELLEPIRRYEPQIQAFCGIDREESQVVLMNSLGYRGSFRSTGFSLFVGGELVDGENMLWVYDGTGRGNLGNPRAEGHQLVEKVLEQFRLGRRNVDMRSGRYPVLFSPHALGDLLRPLVASLDGKAVEKGFSPWKERMGQTVASDKVHLTDDGTLPFGPGTAPFDGEGTPCQPTPLISGGRLDNFYLDRRTARLLGRKPTGNGQRGLGSLPSPGPSNMILAGGDTPYREMLKGIREGVYIEQVMGAWAGNPYSGEVSGNISLGYLVRDGEPVGRIKDCLFAANAFEAFQGQLAGLSREQAWAGAELLPYALFDGITISTKG